MTEREESSFLSAANNYYRHCCCFIKEKAYYELIINTNNFFTELIHLVKIYRENKLIRDNIFNSLKEFIIYNYNNYFNL